MRLMTIGTRALKSRESGFHPLRHRRCRYFPTCILGRGHLYKTVYSVERYNEENCGIAWATARSILITRLKGDPSDNIPGVSELGKNRPEAFLGTYGSMDGIYGYSDELACKFG